MPIRPSLLSKTQPPPLLPHTIERIDVFQRLDAAVEALLTVVTAPAGFGKSTVVASWIEFRALDAAWVSCDEDDQRDVRFLAVIVEAVRRKRPEAFAETYERLNDDVLPEFADLTATFVNEAYEIQESLIVVLDDHHQVPADTLRDVFGALMNGSPTGLHIIAIGRTDPPLPLARLRARGLLVELRSVDLLFGLDDVRTVVERTSGITLENDHVVVLRERTEGWPAGVSLAALSLRRHKDVDAFLRDFAGADAFVLDYLLEEVLNDVPDDLRMLLSKLALVEVFDADLCAILAEADGKPGSDQLVELSRRSLFVVPLSETSSWYRFYGLFAEAVRTRLPLPVSEADDVRRHAALRCIEAGQIPAALRMVQRMSDVESKITVLEYSWTAVDDDATVVNIGVLVDTLPDDVVALHPRLLYLQSLSASNTMNLERLAIHVERLEAALPRERDDVARRYLRAHVEFFTGALEMARGRFISASDSFRNSVETFRSLTASEATAAGIRTASLETSVIAAHAMYSRSLVTLTDVDGAIGVLRFVVDRYIARQRFQDLASVQRDIGNVHIIRGDVERARRASADSYVAVAASGATVPQSERIAHVTLDGRIAFESGDFDTALDCCRRAYRIFDERPGLGILYLINAIQTDHRIRVLRHEWDEAIRLIDIVRGEEHGMLAAPVRNKRRVMESGMAMARGDTAAVKKWVEECREQGYEHWEQESEAQFARLGAVIQFIIASIRCGDGNRVVELTAAAKQHATAMNLHRQIGEFHVITWLDAVMKGAEGAARTAIREAVTIMRLYGTLSPSYHLTEIAEVAGPWLDDIRSEDPSEGTTSVLDAIERVVLRREAPFAPFTHQRQTTPATNVFEVLTERELDTLRHLVMGLSNQRIADRMFVSLATVKTHLYNIYQKLNVTSRAEAIVTARDAGLHP